MSGEKHTPGLNCSACEGFCLVRPANYVSTRGGLVRAICKCCGRESRAGKPGPDGEPDMWRLARGWSTAPFPVDCEHADGSVGSTFTCPACNARLRKGGVLQVRSYLPGGAGYVRSVGALT